MKKSVTLFIILAFPIMLFAQILEGDEERDVRDLTTPERVFVGGFVGLQFGTFTAVNLSLHGGYRITNRLSAGLGGMYQYSNDRWFGQSISSHVYGGSVFARFRVFFRAFIHAEHEWLSVQSRPYLDQENPSDPSSGDFSGDRPRSTEKNMLLGPGYAFRVSPRITLNIMALYNFNQESKVYFDNPFFRAGVDVSLQ
ncbi:MAG: hypothetical protein R6U86_05175 [Bacteroidales bacterium]